MSRRPPRAIALALATALPLATGGCGDATPEHRITTPTVFDPARDASAGVRSLDPARRDVLTAVDLRDRLEGLLAWHGIVVVQLTRAARIGSTAVPTWLHALQRSDADLAAVIGVAYGPAAASAFDQQWGQHGQFLVDYAVAVGNGDRSAAARALAALRAYSQDAGAYFATVTGGRVQDHAARELLDAHIDHVVAMITADGAGDVASARRAAMADVHHATAFAIVLASAIAAEQPAAFPGPATSSAADLLSRVRGQTVGVILARLLTPEVYDRTDPAVQQAMAALVATVSGRIDVAIGPLEGLSGSPDEQLATAQALLASARAWARFHAS